MDGMTKPRSPMAATAVTAAKIAPGAIVSHVGGTLAADQWPTWPEWAKGLFQLGAGAAVTSSYDFTEADTNVEKEGYVAPEGMVFVAKSMGVLAGVPFIDNANSEDYPEWIDEYAPKAIEVLLANARVAIYPNGEKNGEFSLGSLMLNPSQRGITSGASLPQVIQSIGGLPVPIDGEPSALRSLPSLALVRTMANALGEELRAEHCTLAEFDRLRAVLGSASNLAALTPHIPRMVVLARELDASGQPVTPETLTAALATDQREAHRAAAHTDDTPDATASALSSGAIEDEGDTTWTE